MIDPTHQVSITRQAELLQRRIDELHLEYPFAEARTLKKLLRREGHRGGPKWSCPDYGRCATRRRDVRCPCARLASGFHPGPMR
jgi:hypothetical protein